jgi:molybdopterin converting factor subunit 1
MLKVRLLHFAVLREIAGRDEELLQLTEGTRAADVWQRLRDEYAALRDYATPPLIAINENYVSPQEILHDGDELVFIPPVAGG